MKSDPCGRNPAVAFVARWSAAVAPLLCIALMVCLVTAPALATSGTWTNLAGGSWGTASNWFSNSIANGTDGIADFSTLDITANNTVLLDKARSIGQLNFSDKTNPNNNWILSNTGFVLTMDVSAGIPTITVNNQQATISLVLGGNDGLSTNGAGLLFLNNTNTFTGGLNIQLGTVLVNTVNNVSTDGPLGHIGSVVMGSSGQTGTLEYGGATAASTMPFTLATSGVGAFQVDGGSGVNLTLNGLISGSGSLVKTGTGILTLGNASNSYTGGTTINAGTLSIASAANLGTSSTVTFGASSTGTLSLRGDTILTGLNTNATAGTTFIQNETSIFGVALHVNNSSANTYAGTIQNGSAGGILVLIKTGNGTLTLSGTNSFSGGLSVQQGTLAVATFNNQFSNGPLGNNGVISFGGSGSTGTVEYTGNTASSSMALQLLSGGTGAIQIDAAATNLTVSGQVSGLGAFTKTGPGTLTLSNANSSFTGALSIQQGTLAVPVMNNVSSNGPLGNHVSVSLTSTLEITGATASSTMPLVLNSGNSTVQVDIAATNLTLSGVLSGSTLNKSGPGTLTLSGTNTFNAGLAVLQGNLAIATITDANTDGRLGHIGGVALGSSGQTGTLEYTGATVSSNMPFSLATGGTGAFQIDTAAVNLTLSGAISGAGALAKTGSGTLTLTATNTFTGGLSVQQGNLAVASMNNASTNGVLGNITSMTLGSSGQTGTLEYTGAGAASSNLPIVLASGGTDIIQVIQATSLSLSGAISGSGALTTSGGTVMLSGVNTFTGGLTVKQGTLAIASMTDASTDGPLGHTTSVTLGVTPGVATLQYTGTTASSNMPFVLGASSSGTIQVDTTATNLTLSGVFSGSGGLIKTGDGTLTLSGTNTFTGGLSVSQGTVAVPTMNKASTAGPFGVSTSTSLGSNGKTGTIEYTGSGVVDCSMPFSLVGGGSGAFQLDNAAAKVTLSGVVSGSGALIKSGDGILILALTNTFTGGLTVQQGVVSVSTINNVSTNGQLGNNTSVTLGSSGQTGTLEYAGGTASSTMPFVMASGGTGAFQIDGANLTLSGVISGSGALSKTSAGTLTLTNTNTFTGGLLVQQGIVSVSSITDAGTDGVLGHNANVTLGSSGQTGTLEYTGATAASTMPLSLVSGGSGAIQVDTAGTNLTLTGVISGSGALIKNGDGTLTLILGNTFSGGMSINRGRVVFSGDNSFVDSALGTGALTLGSAGQTATLELNTNAGFVGTSKTITLTANSTSTIQVDSGLLTLSANSGGIVGGGSLVKTGAGELTMSTSAANTFTGGLTIAEGNVGFGMTFNVNTNGPFGKVSFVTLGANGATGGIRFYTSAGASGNMPFVLANGGTGSLTTAGPLTLSGQISGTGALLVAANAGTSVTLSGQNTFSGGLTVQQSTLIISTINNAGGSGPLGTSGVTLGSSGQSATLSYTGGATSSNMPFTLAAGGTGIISSTNNLTLSGVISGAGALTKTTFSALTLSGANTFSGGLTVQSGTLIVPTVNNAGATGPLGQNTSVTLGTNGQIGTLEYTGATSASNMALVLGPGGVGGQIQADTAAANLTLSAVISGSGTLFKAGAGTVTLTGVNNFTGSLTVAQGNLAVATMNDAGVDGPLGHVTGVTFGSPFVSSSQTATLEYTGVSASSNMPLTVTPQLFTPTGVVQVDSASANLTLTGAVTGTGPFRTSGAGTVTLAGANSFVGGLTVQQGTLAVSNLNSNIGNAAVTVGSAGQTGTLEYTGSSATSNFSSLTTATSGTAVIQVDNAATNMTLASVISGSGGLVKTGDGTLTLSNTNTFSGGLTISRGALAVAVMNNAATNGPLGNNSLVTLGSNGQTVVLEYTGGTASTNMPINLPAGAVGAIAVDTAATNLACTGNITGSGSFTKIGPGTLTLLGSNSFSGGAIISAGALNLASATGLGTGPLTVSPGAALNMTGGLSVVLPAAVTVGVGAKINSSGSSLSTGGGGINHGSYGVVGGMLSFTASSGGTTNAADGKINLVDSTLNLGSGVNQLINSGRMNLIDATINGDIQSTAGAVINTAGNVTFNGNVMGLGALQISDGLTTLAATTPHNTVVVSSLSDSGTLDVTNNSLMISYIGASPVATIAGYLASGFNAGNWNGVGINSSAASGDATFLTALGYKDDGSTVTIKYTYYGDNNLDGVVNATDFQMFLDGLAATNASSWTQGDYTYDGKVDLGNDFNLFLISFLKQGGALGDLAPMVAGDAALSVSQKAQLLVLVPEPTSGALVAVCGLGIMGRRRSRHSCSKIADFN